MTFTTTASFLFFTFYGGTLDRFSMAGKYQHFLIKKTKQIYCCIIHHFTQKVGFSANISVFLNIFRYMGEKSYFSNVGVLKFHSLYLRFLQHYTVILQRARIIARDAGFELGSLVRAAIEPPLL